MLSSVQTNKQYLSYRSVFSVVIVSCLYTDVDVVV